MLEFVESGKIFGNKCEKMTIFIKSLKNGKILDKFLIFFTAKNKKWKILEKFYWNLWKVEMFFKKCEKNDNFLVKV